jgi:hypothetical protein
VTPFTQLLAAVVVLAVLAGAAAVWLVHRGYLKVELKRPAQRSQPAQPGQGSDG